MGVSPPSSGYSYIIENSLGNLGEVDTRYWEGNLSVEYNTSSFFHILKNSLLSNKGLLISGSLPRS